MIYRTGAMVHEAAFTSEREDQDADSPVPYGQLFSNSHTRSLRILKAAIVIYSAKRTARKERHT